MIIINRKLFSDIILGTTNQNAQVTPLPAKRIKKSDRVRLYSNREKVSSDMLERAKKDGVVQRKPNGMWGIISIKKGEWWDANYKSRSSAEAGLRGYQMNK